MTGIIVNILLSSVILLSSLVILQPYIPSRLLYTIFTAYFILLLTTSIPEIHSQLQSPTYLITLLSIILLLSSLCWILVLKPNTEIYFQLLDKLTISALLFTGVYSVGFVIPQVRKILIETVTQHTQQALSLFGYTTKVQTGPDYGYLSQLVYLSNGTTYLTYIELACTGLGAIAVICGLIYLLDMSIFQKVILFFISTSIIYLLNLIRNIFIAIAFFSESFSKLPFLFSSNQSEALVSFTIAEVYISQVVSTVLLFCILYFLYYRTTIFCTVESEIHHFVESLKTSL